MPSASDQALALLPDEHRQRVEGAFAEWEGAAANQPAPHQWRLNLEAETALSVEDCRAFLEYFATELAAGRDSAEAWKKACYGNQLLGRELAKAQQPQVLGRVMDLEHYARLLAPRMPLGEAMEKLRQGLPADERDPFRRQLARAPLSRFIIWACFQENDPGTSPFQPLPANARAVRCALGLGRIPETNLRLVLLTWRHTEPSDPVLHRPTVADAADNNFYRPVGDPDFPWGLTEPLPPNEDGLARQPEVVIKKRDGRNLISVVVLEETA